MFFFKINLKEEEYCLVLIMKVGRICRFKSYVEIDFKVCMIVIILGLNFVNVVYKIKKVIKLVLFFK